MENKIKATFENESVNETEFDNVNKPKHYIREGGMECIDEMITLFGEEAVINFCLCNAWKYRYRASEKNGEEDLRKSDWYIKKYKELKESKELLYTTDNNHITIKPLTSVTGTK